MNENIATDITNFLNKNRIYTDIKLGLKGVWDDADLLETINTNFIWRQIVDYEVKFAINLKNLKWDKYGYTGYMNDSFYISSELVELKDVRYRLNKKPRKASQYIPKLKVHFCLYFKISDNSAIFVSEDYIDVAEEGNLNNRIKWEELPIRFENGEFVHSLNGSLTKGVRV